MVKGFIFSALQIFLVIYILLSGPVFIFSVPFVLTGGLSLFILFWAILSKRLYKQPSAHKAQRGIYFLKDGPYEFLRHPIAAVSLLFVSSFVQEYFTLSRVLVFLFFIILTVMRIGWEGKETERYFKYEYSSYKKKTKRLIPYLY